MSQPNLTSYSAATGQTIYGGRAAPGGGGANPAWLQAITAGQWGTLPNSTLSTSGAGWTGTPPGGSDNYLGVIMDYSGAVLNTVGCYYNGQFNSGTFLVPKGGGHSSYGGNEIYAYGPLETTPTWHRLNDPTIPAIINADRDAAGNYVTYHTYDSAKYLPATNEMVMAGAAARYGHAVGYGFFSHIFNFNNNTWSPNDAGFPASINETGGSGFFNGRGGYNPSTGIVWGILVNNYPAVMRWDTATRGPWTSVIINAGNGFFVDKAKSSIHPAKNIFVQFRNADGLEYLDLSNVTSTSVFVRPTISGAAPASTDGAMLDWDPSINKFVSWDRSGTAMYFLTLPADHVNGTWVWTSAAGTGGATPALPQFQGTHGRFRAVPSLGGVLLMSTGVDPICFYKY